METSVKDTCRKRCWQFFLCLVFVVMIAIAGWLLWKYAFGRGSGDGNGTPGVTPDQCALRNGTVFGAYCYVSPNLQMTWPDAEAYCVGLSGHLASIKSQPENDFVFNMMFNPTHSLFNNSGWIGLKRTGGDIGWSDGGNTDAFTYWNFDDPNPNAGYDCGAQVKSPATRWSLFFCSDVKYFCCKFPLASIPLKPRGLVATPGGRSASVTFYAPTSDGGAPINRYFIKATPGGKTSNFSVTGNAPYTGSITGLTEGVSYTLQVAAVNDIGMGPYSDPSSPVVPYAVAPGAPQGVVAQPGSNAVAVLFSAPADNGGSPVTYYLVNHTTTTSNTVDRANITESPAIFTQNLLAAPAPMTFTVQAFTRVGPSPIITVSGVVLNPALPAYIPQPTAVAGNGFVDLTWTTVTADNFTIFSDIKSVPNTAVPAGVNPTQTYRISGLSVSVCYRFSVFATNSIGNGAPSPYSVAACPFAVVPTAPLNAQAVNQGLSAVVNFSAPTSDGLAPITSYTVTAAFDTNGTILGTVSGTSSPITYSPLPEGEDIYFKVAAVNSVGTGPSVNTNYITVAPGVAQPPTAVTATASAQSVVLSWVAPTNDGGRAVSQYNITAIPAAPGFPFIVGNVLTATVPPDTSAFWLSTATNYTFTVRSINALGYGDASVASNAVVPLAQKPFPPTITGVNATRRGVNVSFTAPANNGGSLITRYILNGTNGSLTFVGGAANFAVATQLVPNQFYSFTLRASNAVGDSGYSGVSASIRAGPDVPNSPRNIAASPNDGSITVTFTPAADDGGSPVTSFTVYISPGGYQTVGAQSPLTVGGVPNDYSYVATVVATNAVGNSLPSVASNAVTPTGKSINKAAIIGGVIGGLVLLCLVGICVCYSQDYLCFRKKDQGPVMFQEPGPSGNQSSMNLTAGQMTTDTPSTFAVLGGVVNDSSSHQ